MLRRLVRHVTRHDPGAPQDGQWGVWIFDWREEEQDNVDGPAFLIAYERRIGGQLCLFVPSLWFLNAESEDLAAAVSVRFDDQDFIANEIASGRLRRIGPLPRLSDDSPHHRFFCSRDLDRWLAPAA
jgi:hypothetical protein